METNTSDLARRREVLFRRRIENLRCLTPGPERDEAIAQAYVEHCKQVIADKEAPND